MLRKKKDATDAFIRYHGLPHELASRWRLYQQCVWTRGAGGHLTAVVQEMNSTIRADIMNSICHSIFVCVPMFRQCGADFIAALMNTMLLEVSTP